MGIPGTQAFAGFSAQNVNGLSTVGSNAGGTNFIDNTFQYGDNLTWQRGKHLIKAGVEFIRYQQNNFYPGNDGANGQFNYGNNGNGTVSYTSNPFIAGTSAKGYAPADFVLDRAAFVGIGGISGRTGQRQWRSAYFVQDDWKVRSNLTLNIGLRYEYFQPIFEVNNKEVNVNLANGTLEFPGSVPAGQPAGSTICPNRACYNATYNNFMPRLGFALQPNPRLVVRGGFGITKAMEGTGANLRLTYNPPFQSSLELYGVAPSTTTTGTFFKVENGFSASATPNFGSGFYRANDPNLKPQVTNEYSLTTEYQVSNVSSVRIGYVGELSQHLIQAVAGNQLKTPCVIGGVLQTDPNSAACAIANPAPFKALVGQSGGLFETVSEGMANYNALQASYRQRASKGLEYTVNYSYARAMTNAVGFFGVAGINGPSPYAQNAYNNSAEYGPAGSDVRHSLNATAVYAVPFGRGKQFGSHTNFLLDEILGGWKVAGTAVVYSGAPVTISGPDVAGTNNKTARPNQVSNIKVTSHTVNNWFGGIGNIDNGKYATPANGTYGNAAVGTERAPGYQQYDFAAFKDFTIFHENRIGFRADAFNALNQTSLGAPNSDSTSAQFGQITSVRSPQRQIQFSAKYQF